VSIAPKRFVDSNSYWIGTSKLTKFSSTVLAVRSLGQDLIKLEQKMHKQIILIPKCVDF
jgi:hypothetical protein